MSERRLLDARARKLAAREILDIAQDEETEAIREAVSDGWSQSEVGRLLGMSRQNVHRIVECMRTDERTG